MKVQRLPFLLLLLLLLLTICSACTGVFEEMAPQTEGAGRYEALFTDAPPVVSPELTTDLQVYFLDVGQGDSILILLPNGQTMLIDGGRQVESDRLLAYLQRAGVETIDFLVATNPQAEHIGGLPAVLAQFEVRAVYMPQLVNTSQVFEELMTAIEQKDLTVNTARAGVNIIDVPDLRVDLLAPSGDSYRETSNFSAIIKLTYKDVAFLFTGDAQRESEKRLTAELKADVLKVGHHGSNTATGTAFLKKVDPQIAVISCGDKTRYGNPSDVLLRRLKKAGVTVYRTDEKGTIGITSDGATLEVTTGLRAPAE